MAMAINATTNVSEVWTKIKILQNRANHRNETPPIDEWIHSLHNNLTPPSCQELYINTVSSVEPFAMLEEFSLAELEHCIKQTTNSAPGHDSIHYPMIANPCTKAKSLLLYLFNDVWMNC